jgi:hypothetical protein
MRRNDKPLVKVAPKPVVKVASKSGLSFYETFLKKPRSETSISTPNLSEYKIPRIYSKQSEDNKNLEQSGEQ